MTKIVVVKLDLERQRFAGRGESDLHVRDSTYWWRRYVSVLCERVLYPVCACVRARCVDLLPLPPFFLFCAALCRLTCMFLPSVVGVMICSWPLSLPRFAAACSSCNPSIPRRPWQHRPQAAQCFLWKVSVYLLYKVSIQNFCAAYYIYCMILF